jgi:DNA polymerase-3 subunit epsilon
MQFYCKENFENAHDAMADTLATMKVLVGQIDFYKNKEREIPESGIKVINPLGDSLQSIHEFINVNDKRVDFTGRFVRNENDEIIFNFGNQKGNLAYQHPNVLRWIIDKDFPLQVKNIAQAILTGKLR